jgi:predicted metal-dependent enzyme (double-stranded beta helix superfamily)
VLTAEQRLGSPDGYVSHTLHVEPDGSFSIVALVWRPGQITRIHDHISGYYAEISPDRGGPSTPTPKSAQSPTTP